MNVFRQLWESMARLAASLNGLAATVDALSDHVRQRAGLMLETQPEPLTLDGGHSEPAPLSAARKRKTTP